MRPHQSEMGIFRYAEDGGVAGHSTKYPFPTLVFQALAAYDSPVSRACHTPIALLKTTAVDIDVPIYLVSTPVEPWVLGFSTDVCLFGNIPFFFMLGGRVHITNQRHHHHTTRGTSTVFSHTIRRAGARARVIKKVGSCSLAVSKHLDVSPPRRTGSVYLGQWGRLFTCVCSRVWFGWGLVSACVFASSPWPSPGSWANIRRSIAAFPRHDPRPRPCRAQIGPCVRLSTLLEVAWFIRGPPACLCQSCL